MGFSNAHQAFPALHLESSPLNFGHVLSTRHRTVMSCSSALSEQGLGLSGLCGRSDTGVITAYPLCLSIPSLSQHSFFPLAKSPEKLVNTNTLAHL